MNAEYVNAFLKSLNDILDEVADIHLYRNELNVKNKFQQSSNNVIILGISGDLKGNIVIGLDDFLALTIASQMVGSNCFTVNDIVKSAIGELFNMVLGRASITLSQIGKTIDITPPTYITGHNLDVKIQVPLISVGFDFCNHKLNFDISISEN